MLSASKAGLAILIMAFSATNTYTTVSYPDPNIFSGVHTAEASAYPLSMTLEEIEVLVKKYAVPKHVKQNSMLETIKCEAPKNPDGTYNPGGQSEIIAEDGIREDSWGITQISLPHHPEIKKEQAQNAEFSIQFMASEFEAGRAERWSCFRKLKKNGII